LTAATTATGMLLTRRGLTRGFCVMTPRLAGGGLGPVSTAERARLPIVFYMAVSVTAKIAAELVEDGLDPSMPAAVVFGAGSDQAYTVSGTLADIGEKVGERSHELPGTLIVGEVTDYRYRSDLGALQGCRVLLTASRALQDKAATLVTDYGGIPVCRPLIRLVSTPNALDRVRQLDAYDWVVLTSPSAVRCFGELLRQGGVDSRRVPTLVSCGGGTSAELVSLGLKADIEPPSRFGAAGLLDTMRQAVTKGTRVLRLRSDKAGPSLADALRESGATVEDCVLYRNEPVEYEDLPEFDAVFFASASAVEAFDGLWGAESLAGKTVLAIGKPTLAALEKLGVTADLVGPEATVESCLTELAMQHVRQSLLQYKEEKP
ncbi:MAG: uroporphyrinogen-III synthase, partial [Lentisphaerae bacterium]|nr:uroporphyrinogen-III synthase [Lentisphaerota bacterium]